MGVVPSLQELDGTIARLIGHFRSSPDPRAAHLLDVYERLSPRFADDLSDRRDIALSRDGALMMARYLLEEID